VRWRSSGNKGRNAKHVVLHLSHQCLKIWLEKEEFE
jgi:hypothetical protein